MASHQVADIIGLETALQSVGGGTPPVFELDSYGDLMPSQTVVADANFESDINGDLMPKDV
jgi:hypothetical protein